MSEKLRTPDAPLSPVAFQQYLITMPVLDPIEDVFWGAIAGVSFYTAWIDYGTMPARDAAEYIKNIFLSRRKFEMLGTIQAVIRDSLHSSMLICDGGVYNKDDYPQLWEVWPSAMKDSTTLTLPDLRNLFLVGATMDYSLGDTGGEAEVTLSEGEMPSHSHTNTPHNHAESLAAPIPIPVGVGVPVPAAAPAIGVTGFSGVVIDNTGGGLPHNNLPPYYAVVYAVIAKVGT